MFQLAVYEYRLVGFGLSGLIAGFLPALEVVAGLALALGIFPIGAALASSGLFATFIAALTHSLLVGGSAECGCFGIFSLTTPVALGLDVALFACSITVLVLELSKTSDDTGLRRCSPVDF